MAATVAIQRYTGVSPTGVNITANTVVTLNDSPQIYPNASHASVANPIPIPASGGVTHRSWWCTTGLNVTVAPATGINNIRWYSDGTNNTGTGCDIMVGNQTLIRASQYVRAVGGGVGGTGLAMVTGITAITTESSAFTKTSGSPLTVTGSIGATTGALGNFVVYQFTVINTAGPGPTTQETFTWAFDET